MTRTELLLVILMEECDETSQRASKAIRFGLDEIQEGQELNNLERLIYEFNDILATLQLIYKGSVISHEMISLKKDKIEKWLKYSESCGTLVNEETLIDKP